VAHQLGGGAGAGLTLFANLARNNRVPTVIELGCADPDEPCRLPAGLQADPYLKQVVSTTLEAGLRFGGNGSPWRGSVALYRTHNRDDILFRSTSVVGQLGYFENFARTRHQGLDAELATRFGPVDLGLTYSHLDATYQAGGTLRMGERNVTIRPGTRIAGLPRHQLKLSADWAAGGGFSLGGDVQALSGRGVAGNEDGLMADQGARVDFGLPGYAIVNLRASWKPAAAQGLEVYARVSNAFNRRYASFGAVAETVFDAQGSLSGDEADAVFVAPGAPRAFTLGLRYSF
jgi:outer membrane cobalamin receptor